MFCHSACGVLACWLLLTYIRGGMMIEWRNSLEEAMAEAGGSRKFILLDFFSPT
jgi:hypothetical protein